jgi:hypothetical protein
MFVRRVGWSCELVFEKPDLHDSAHLLHGFAAPLRWLPNVQDRGAKVLADSLKPTI